MAIDLHGAVVVITGASSGIGEATAHAFAREGSNLVLAARDLPALEEVARACEASGVRAIAVETDITDPDAVARLADTARNTFGTIHIWMSNVGVGPSGVFRTRRSKRMNRSSAQIFWGTSTMRMRCSRLSCGTVEASSST